MGYLQQQQQTQSDIDDNSSYVRIIPGSHLIFGFPLLNVPLPGRLGY